MGENPIVSIGGDGTHGEVVDGLLRGRSKGSSPSLYAPLPAGTGSDFCRYIYGGAAFAECVTLLEQGQTTPIDVGHSTYQTHTGDAGEHYFLNIAGVGIGGLVDFLVNQTTKAFGGKASFLIGTLRGLIQYKPAVGTVTVDNEIVYEGPVLNVLACNGQYAGGGMHFAPTAKLEDGQLDFIVIPMLPKWRLGLEMRHLYDGSYLRNPQIIHVRGLEASFCAPTRESDLLSGPRWRVPGCRPRSFHQCTRGDPSDEQLHATIHFPD